MNTKEQELRKRLRATFKIEAAEHIRAISDGLLELEKRPRFGEQMPFVESVFRAAHSLKGSARTVNETEIEACCHALESIFAAWKRQELGLSGELFDLLHQSVDHLNRLLISIESEIKSALKSQTDALIYQMEEALRAPAPVQPAEPARIATSPSATEPLVTGPRAAPVETIRITAAKLSSLLLQVEELLSAKQTASQHTNDLREILRTLDEWKKEWTKIRAAARPLQQALEKENGDGKRLRSSSGATSRTTQILKILEFFDRQDAFAKSLEHQLGGLAKSAEQDRRTLAGMVDHLVADMRKVLMRPFSSVLEVFPKLVRDLSRDCGKEVELVMQGAELAIDRRILEQIKDPLIHVVRNSIDHGIELPETREKGKKARRGRLTIAISQKTGGKAEILVTDDGAGIEAAKVRTAAIKLGILTEEQAETLTDEEAVLLVFCSGVSTSSIITDVSGRGLGLAIVREKVEELGGVISLETHPDRGTALRMILPLALATFRGVVVRVQDWLFILPSASIERVVRAPKAQINTIENRETMQLNGQTISVARLSEALHLDDKHSGPATGTALPAIILGSGSRRIALLVDEVLHEQEVLVKPLGKQLARVRNISGAAVLGDGRVAPVLNVPDLFKSAIRAGAAGPRTGPVAGRESIPDQKKAVLVAEDSITARTFLKSILTAAGYDVATAVDGLDALTKLRESEFDLLISDVEMPRMNGFDLTARIRADKKLLELPIVLVTALESREHRERGIDVGANAYIVKSSFDQSNLIEVVARLI